MSFRITLSRELSVLNNGTSRHDNLEIRLIALSNSWGKTNSWPTVDKLIGSWRFDENIADSNPLTASQITHLVAL